MSDMSRYARAGHEAFFGALAAEHMPLPEATDFPPQAGVRRGAEGVQLERLGTATVFDGLFGGERSLGKCVLKQRVAAVHDALTQPQPRSKHPAGAAYVLVC